MYNTVARSNEEKMKNASPLQMGEVRAIAYAVVSVPLLPWLRRRVVFDAASNRFAGYDFGGQSDPHG